jgi:hypothetical protein
MGTPARSIPSCPSPTPGLLDPSTELAISLEELAHRAREPHLVATATAARYRTASLGLVIELDVLVEPLPRGTVFRVGEHS